MQTCCVSTRGIERFDLEAFDIESLGVDVVGSLPVSEPTCRPAGIFLAARFTTLVRSIEILRAMIVS